MALKLKVYTIFPEIFPGFLGFSLTGRALEEGIWSLETVNIRDYALDKHGSVDDTPCGGGAGMVMRADILGRALKANHRGGRILAMSPRGLPLTQEKVHELSRESEISVVCGRFEGIDERVLESRPRRLCLTRLSGCCRGCSATRSLRRARALRTVC